MVFAPFLGRYPIIVIWSPFLIMSRSQPCLVRTFGLLASLVHISHLPLSSFVSTEIITWGLLNWKSVTVPFTVVNFVVSYADVPWCAKMGAATMRRITIPADVAKNQFFMRNPYRLPIFDHASARRFVAPTATRRLRRGMRYVSSNSLYHCAPRYVKAVLRVKFIQA